MDGPGLGHVRGSQPHRPIYQCCEVEGRTQELVAGGTRCVDSHLGREPSSMATPTFGKDHGPDYTDYLGP